MVWIPTKIRNTPSESSSSMQTDLILDYLISDQQQLNMSDCHVTMETWSWITWWYPDWGGFKVTCRKEGCVSVCWWLTDTSDFHAWTGQSSESRLGSRSRSLCPENRQFQSDCKTYKTYTNCSPTDRYGCVPVSSGGSQLDVQSCDPELLAALSDVLSCQHGGVWRRLVSVGLHLHPAGDTADCLPGGTQTNQTSDTGLQRCLQLLHSQVNYDSKHE